MDRSDSVIIDPVLCYVSNHWKTVSDHDLRSVISRYFADVTIAGSYDRLNQQTAPFLDAIDDEERSGSAIGNVEAIVRIFRLCDRYRITLPEFAVTDLKTLPPPPYLLPAGLESLIVANSAISSATQSVNNTSTSAVNGLAACERASSEALFTRRALLKIVKELKQLKSLVIDLSLQKSTRSSTVVEGECADFELKEENCPPSPAQANEDEDKALLDDCPASNDSVHAANSPPPNGDEQHPPSRDSSASVSRTALTPPRKRGSSRSSSSIEDAVAKIKARGGGNPLSMIFQRGLNPNVDMVDSGSPSPKTGLEEAVASSLSTNEKSPNLTPVYCDTAHVKSDCGAIFPSVMAARNLAAAIMDPGLFLPSGVSRSDLVNSAAAMMASGVFPVAHSGILAAALSPRGTRGFLPFSTSTPQQSSVMESCFSAPTSTTPCVSPLVRQQSVKEPSAFRAGRATIPRTQQQDDQKPKKAAKRRDLTSPTTSDPEDARKRQHREQSDGDSSVAESSAGGQGNGTKKPWECTHQNCRKRFSNKFLLKKHEFIHTGLRPHQCPYCLKRFNRKDNLLRHKVTHEKNYTTPRRRSCRVFGVKGTIAHSSSHQSDLVTASAGSSPTDSKICVRQRSASCAPNENEVTNRQPTPISAPAPAPPQAQASFHSAPVPTSAEFSLAALASYTALAQSLWPRAAMSGVHSMNN